MVLLQILERDRRDWRIILREKIKRETGEKRCESKRGTVIYTIRNPRQRKQHPYVWAFF